MAKGVVYREVTYLSGPMDMAPDWGVEWRENLTPDLTDLGLIVQDPILMTLKLLRVSSMEEAREKMDKLEKENKKEYHSLLKKIERNDLRAVCRSHFIITFWDWRIITYGTTVENDTAARHRIPIYCVSYAPESALPSWLKKDIEKSGGMLVDSFRELLKVLRIRKNIIMQYKRMALKA